jgi:hypothetical protein
MYAERKALHCPPWRQRGSSKQKRELLSKCYRLWRAALLEMLYDFVCCLLLHPALRYPSVNVPDNV